MWPAKRPDFLRRAFDRFWYAAVLAYLLGSVLIVVVWIDEGVVDAAFWWGLQWLTLPWMVVAYIGWWLLDPAFPRHVRRWGLHVVLALWGAILGVGSGGYVALANHLIGPHKVVIEEGTVQKLGRISGRYGPTEYVVTLRRQDGSTVKLYVPKDVHATLRAGQRYRSELVRGGLGLPYRLK